jgi:hypothetical protein
MYPDTTPQTSLPGLSLWPYAPLPPAPRRPPGWMRHRFLRSHGPAKRLVNGNWSKLG